LLESDKQFLNTEPDMKYGILSDRTKKAGVGGRRGTGRTLKPGLPRFCIYVQSLPRKTEEKRDCWLAEETVERKSGIIKLCK
jgi:hypothetical protein